MLILRRIRALLMAAAMVSPTALADVLILTPDSDYARELAGQLKSRIQPPSRVVHLLDVNSETELVVALGRDSFLNATENTQLPVVGSFLSSVDRPTAKSKASTYRVFSDPSPELIAEFLRVRFPNSNIGYIYTDDEAPLVNRMHEALKDSTTRLEPVRFSGNTFSDIRTLSRKRIDAMLISKNREIYHPERVRFVLEALFRKKMPVVSMSASLVPAGATVSVAPTAEAVINTTSEAVNTLISGELPAPQRAAYAAGVTIEVNPTMSRYFNIDFGGGPQ